MKRAALSFLFLLVGWMGTWIPVQAEDWPMWRYDANRSAASPEELPNGLRLQWQLDYPPLVPAWPDESRMQFDSGYEPVGLGDTLFIPSSYDDSLTAVDVKSGAERWKYFTEGPIRFAPAAWKDRVFVGSDDGCLYALRARDGALLWKHAGAPRDRKILGNSRLINTWPARGGVVVAGDTVYYTAGIWPFMGVFLYALDAETGAVRWGNDGSGSMYITQPHNSPAFAGLAPQGYLVAIQDKLLVPNGRSVTACLDRSTGELIYYHHGENNKNGDSHTCAIGSLFFNSNRVFDLQTGKASGNIPIEPILTADALYIAQRGRISALDLQAHGGDAMSREERSRLPFPTTWEISYQGDLFIKAGSRIYAGTGHELVAIQVPTGGQTPRVAWNTTIEGTPWSMLAASGRLMVVTREGGIFCYAGEERPMAASMPPPDSPASPAGMESARTILEQTGVKEGYALVLGVSDGDMLQALAMQSNLQLVALENDAAKIHSMRRRLSDAHLYGSRVAIMQGDSASVSIAPYLAELVVVEESAMADLLADPASIRTIFSWLRPYGGVAWLPVPPDRLDAFAQTVQQADLENAELAFSGGVARLTRAGALPDAGDWTHQYGNPANTVVSKEARVKTPLGLLWFGGSSNSNILPRHGHGPSQQVVGGRLYIEGPDVIRAMDVYTGRVLWEKTLPDIGVFYDNLSHQPGANAIGSNYVSVQDGIYIAYGQTCLRLDPATGALLSQFTLPPLVENGPPPRWGFLAVYEDVLIAGSSPAQFESDADFNPVEFRKHKEEQLKEIKTWLEQFQGVTFPARADFSTDLDWIVQSLNQLLSVDDLALRLPPDPNGRRRGENYEERIAAFLQSRSQPGMNTFILKKLNRGLLTASFALLPDRSIVPGMSDVASDTASQALVVLNRNTGEVLWSQPAGLAFLHNGIVAGGGKIYCLDRLPETVLQALKRRGRTPQGEPMLLCFDAHTGEKEWEVTENIFGTWLSYSDANDILLQAARPSRDMLPEPGGRLITYHGADGSIVWDKSMNYGGPCLIHGQTLYTQGFALDLLTGEPLMRKHPLTGAPIPWEFTRNYGCNTAVASEHLLTFRYAAAGFCDLIRNSGTGNLGGFRSSCTSNLIAADGVLTPPDYTRTCICSYQNQTSLALIHDPEVEEWTFNDIKRGEGPIRQLGINLGAPGDHADEDGTLWLEYPVVGGPSPNLEIRTEPGEPQWIRHHSSRFAGQPLAWVAASGAKGLRNLTVSLDAKSSSAALYTVRLVFTTFASGEVDETWGIELQGNELTPSFHLQKRAGERESVIMQEFQGVPVGNDLRLSLVPKTIQGKGELVLCGVELIAEESA